MSKSDPGDHLHPLAYGADHRLEQITDFNFDEVDRSLSGEEPVEDSVTFGDASAALSLILGWIVGESKTRVTDIKMIAARALTLHYWLTPEQSCYDGMASIARVCDVTRAALSAHLLRLKDGAGCHLSAGKGHHTRAVFSEGQRRAVETGNHSSTSRKDSVRP